MQFYRFIFVYRNPADAIWANYQLQKSESHTGRISMDSFNATDWNEFSIDTSNKWFQQWVNFLNSTLHDTSPDDIFAIKYESLLNVTKRIDIVKDLMTFMKFNHVTEQDIIYAFDQSDNPAIRRASA